MKVVETVFHIGDIITGTPESNKKYFKTNAYGKYKIIGIDYEFGKIIVEIISHTNKINIGMTYGVEPKYFKLVKTGGANLK